MSAAPIRSRGWRARSAAVVAGIAVVGGLAVMPASAAPEPVSTPLAGELIINDNPSDLAGVTFGGTFDPETGELLGTLVFPPGEIAVTTPVTATITHQVTQQGPGTGTVDLDTGEASFAATLVLELQTVAIGDGDPAPLTPCSYIIELNLAGTYDQEASLLSLAEDGFPIVVNPADEGARCAGLSGAIDPQVVSDNNSVDAEMDLSVTDAVAPEPAPTPPPAPPAPPAPAPAPAPVVQPPTFTG